MLVDTAHQGQEFLTGLKTNVQEYVQSAQRDLTSLANEQKGISQNLLESHLLLTTALARYEKILFWTNKADYA